MRKKLLAISILIFIAVALFALYLVLNKGHIGNVSLIAIEKVSEVDQTEVILPKLGLELEKRYLSSKDKKDTSKMTVTIDGETVTDGVVFESSDESVAKVNKKNEIVPIANGKATIKATYDGIEATAEIKVITPIKSMSFTSTNSTIRVGKDLQLKLKTTPSDASIETLKYTSSDESIATVNSNGIVTGVSEGKVTITLYDEYTETEKTVDLTIKK